MARQVVITDDLEVLHDAQRITYSVDGMEFEIDLAEKNAQKLRDALSLRQEEPSSRAASSYTKLGSQRHEAQE
jgi:hypothetical protein